jgi:hypothetical protein
MNHRHSHSGRVALVVDGQSSGVRVGSFECIPSCEHGGGEMCKKRRQIVRISLISNFGNRKWFSSYECMAMNAKQNGGQMECDRIRANTQANN